MKKSLLSLFAVLGTMAVANAQTWVAPESGSDNVAPNTVLVNNDDVTVTTVYSAKVTGYSATIGEYSFSSAMQLRVDGAPTETNPAGTEKADCTPLIISAKTDATLTVYYRRQANSGSYAAGDGKDIKLIDQANLSQIDGTMTLHSTATDYSPASQVFNISEGHTYTLFARGTTGQLYGFDITELGEQPEITDIFYANSTASLNEAGFSQITYQDGATLTLLTTDTSKKWSNGSSIKVDGKNYTSIKLSNGVQNYFTAPEGKVIKNVKIYSYVNDTNVTTSYWKEFNGTNYTLEDGPMSSSKDGANPDVFEFNATEDDCITSFTFTNSGKQLCFVLKVEYYKSDETPAIKYMVNTTAGVEGIGFATVCLPYDANYYNLDHVYTGTIDGNTLVLEDLDRNNAVPANTAVIVAGKLNGSYAVYKSEVAASPLAQANDLQGTVNPIKTPENACVLSVVDNTVGFFNASKFTTIPANKAYLVVSSAGAPIRIAIDDAGISNLAAEKALAEQLFDIQGRKVEAIQGLGIQNGKITFVK